jgi:hypothetical protein
MSGARLLVASSLLLAAYAAWPQSPWREYPSIERGFGRAQDFPEAYREPGEFVVGRLMFPQARSGWALGTGGDCCAAARRGPSIIPRATVGSRSSSRGSR